MMNANYDRFITCLILFLQFQDSSLLDKGKKDYEALLKNWNLPIHPYIIICGNLDNLTHSFVVVNGIHYYCETPLQAIDKCYQALKALRSFPSLIEHVWVFIEQLIFGIQGKKTFTVVDSLITEIEKDLNIQTKTYVKE